MKDTWIYKLIKQVKRVGKDEKERERREENVDKQRYLEVAEGKGLA